MRKHSRREFLQGAAGAVAAAAFLPRRARADVNSQIRVAVVGVNGRGRYHLDCLSENVVAICDCDRRVLAQRAGEFVSKYGRDLEQVVDFRRLLDRKDIDVVSIATPNHTHALVAVLAAQSGKHVYCEKPVSHDVWEGQQIVAAADRYNCLIAAGTQARSSRAVQQAVRYVHDGKLGAIQYVVGTCYKPRPSIGKLDHSLRIPDYINYDLWCGPAAKVDLYRPRLHYDWHWDFNTGNGDIANQGVHQMDIARWILGEEGLAPRVVSFGGRLGYEDAGDTPNTMVVIHDYPTAPLIFEIRGLPRDKQAQSDWSEESMDSYRGSQIGVIAQCEHGHVLVPYSYNVAFAYDLDGKEIVRWTGGGSHFGNFLRAVRSGRRSDLNADIQVGHISSGLCHTANISYLLGQQRTAAEILASVDQHAPLRDSLDRMVRHLRANEIDVDRPAITAGAVLEISPATEHFTNSPEANDLLRRRDRKPYVVPRIA
jgi:predicted dehydrogenase